MIYNQPALPLAFGVIDQSAVVLASVLAALGLMLLAVGWYGLVPRLSANRDAFNQLSETGARIVGAFGCALCLFSITGWPVLTAFGAVGGFFAITLRNSKRERRAAIDRVDAIASWVEVIRDNIAGGAGLQQALRNSGTHAPEPIRVPVRDLVFRLQHESIVPSLQKFAADVAHPTADMAVGSLILASTRSAGSLASVLTHTAKAARDGAAMMRHVESGRSASQSQAKMTAGLVGSVALYMVLTAKEYVAPYDTFVGQIGLFVICTLASIATILLYRLSKLTEPERAFQGVEVADMSPDAPIRAGGTN